VKSEKEGICSYHWFAGLGQTRDDIELPRLAEKAISISELEMGKVR